MLSLESQRVSSKFAFVLFWYITNHLMTGPLGSSDCFSSNLNVSLDEHRDPRETKNSLFPFGASH